MGARRSRRHDDAVPARRWTFAELPLLAKLGMALAWPVAFPLGMLSIVETLWTGRSLMEAVYDIATDFGTFGRYRRIAADHYILGSEFREGIRRIRDNDWRPTP